jgi:DNA-binding beta-propeller fold protein YncE
MNTAKRGYAPHICLLGLCLVWAACHEKDPGSELPEDLLKPPAAIVFSSPAGQISSINLNTAEFNDRAVHDIFTPVTADFTPIGSLVYIVDSYHQKIAALHLPDFSIVEQVLMPATPLDLELDPNAGHFYCITQNGKAWSYSISAAEFDTLLLPCEPARIKGVPPERRYLWVLCPLDSSIIILDTRPFSIIRQWHFSRPPRDVEFSADGTNAYVGLSGTGSGILKLNTETGDTLGFLDATSGVRDLALTDDQRYLVAVDSASGRVKCHDLDSENSWEFRVGAGAGNALFARHSHRLYVQSSHETRVTIVDLLPEGPAILDSIGIPPYVSCFTLWEDAN